MKILSCSLAGPVKSARVLLFGEERMFVSPDADQLARTIAKANCRFDPVEDVRAELTEMAGGEAVLAGRGGT